MALSLAAVWGVPESAEPGARATLSLSATQDTSRPRMAPGPFPSTCSGLGSEMGTAATAVALLGGRCRVPG